MERWYSRQKEFLFLPVSIFYKVLEIFLLYLCNISFAMHIRKCVVVVVSKSWKPSHFRFLLLPWDRVGSDGSWDKHIKSLIIHTCNRQELVGFYHIWNDYVLDLMTHTLILMAELWPSFANSSKGWNANKSLAKALDAVQLHACQCILGCSVTTCDEPVHVDLGLKSWKCRRDFHKLKCYGKIVYGWRKVPFQVIDKWAGWSEN